MKTVIRIFCLLLGSALCVLPGASIKAQRAELGVPLGHQQAIASMRMLPHDATLVTTDFNSIIHRWDLTNKRLIKSVSTEFGLVLRQPNDGGFAAAYPADLTMEGTQYVNVNTGAFLECATTDLEVPWGTSLTADGKYYLSEDGSKLNPTCPEYGDPIDLPFTATAIGPFGSGIYQYKAGQLQFCYYPELDLAPESITLAGATEGELLIFSMAEIIGQLDAGEAGNNYRFWDSSSGELISEVTLAKDDRVNDIHPSGKYLLVQTYGGENNSMRQERRYNLEKKAFDLSYATSWVGNEAMQEFPWPGFIYSAEGEFVVAPDYDGAIHLLNPNSGAVVSTLASHAKLVNSISVSPDGQKLYLGQNQDEYGELVFPANTVEWAWSEQNILTGTEADEGAFNQLFEVLPTYEIPQEEGDMPENDPATVGEPGTIAALANRPEWSLMVQPYWVDYLHRTDFKVHGLHNGQVFFRAATRYEDTTGKLGDIRAKSTASYDTSRIAVGSYGGDVLLFSGRGDFEFALQGHTDAINAVTFFPDGKRLVSASNDGTMKVWDLAKQEELATLVWLDEKDWVVLGPNNLFDASPGAMDLLYYKVEVPNEDEEVPEVEVIELLQMKERYYDPGLLQKLLGFSIRPLRSVVGLEQVDLYPKAYADIRDVHGENISLHGQLSTQGNGGIGKVALFINGKELEEDINPNRETTFSVDLTSYNRYFLYDNVISIQAYNEEGSLRGPAVSVTYIYPEGAKVRGDGDSSEETLLTREQYLDAKLHIICIGTSDYTESDGKSMDLTFPNADAEMMSRALKTVGCELFCTADRDVSPICLTTSDSNKEELAQENISWAFASKDNIEKAFAEVSAKAKAQDVVVVYFSGHGKTYTSNQKDQFHYLTHEVSLGNVGDETATKNAVISSEELTQLLKAIPTYKQVLIIDACNSGKVIDDLAQAEKSLNGSQVRALARMSDRTGLYLITGSAADKVSFEAGKYGQGLLTYALLKGMNSDEVLRKDDGNTYFVGVMELFEYAKNEVATLAKSINGIQRPQLNFPVRAGSFPIGIFNENTKIVLPEAKPTIARSAFHLKDLFIDDLDLSTLVADRFREEMAEGKNARIVYMDLHKAEGAYRIGGQYTVDPESKIITLQANLVLAGEAPVPLLHRRIGKEPIPISGKTINAVATKLLKAVYKALQE